MDRHGRAWLYSALQQQVLTPNRELANFATHASAVPHPFRSLDIVDGRLVLKIPDPPVGRIYLWDEFQFEEDRDALGFARTALGAVRVFVDGMLDAFDDATATIEARRAHTR